MKKIILSLVCLSCLPLVAADGDAMQTAMTAFKSKDWASAKVGFQEVLLAQPNNAIARNFLKIANENDLKARASGRELAKVILPEVRIKDMTVREAFAYISQRIGAVKGDGKPYNIVIIVSDEEILGNKVSISLADIPAFDAIDYIAEAFNLKATFEPHAVKISPEKP